MTDGRVYVEDSVAIQHATTGSELRESYLKDVQKLSAGLIRVRGSALYVGPIELLRFGQAKVTRHAVEWPIEGGILARAAGGRFRIEADGGRLVASVESYRPLLPLPLYRVTQLPIHHLLIRLHLLRVRGRDPLPGMAASSQDRWRAAMVDLALCVALTGVISKRPRVRALLGVAAAYHVTCWSTSGRTLGGLVLRQRVIAVDGSRPTVGQSLVRLLALPLGWVRGRPLQDELACTEVVRI